MAVLLLFGLDELFAHERAGADVGAEFDQGRHGFGVAAIRSPHQRGLFACNRGVGVRARGEQRPRDIAIAALRGGHDYGFHRLTAGCWGRPRLRAAGSPFPSCRFGGEPERDSGEIGGGVDVRLRIDQQTGDRGVVVIARPMQRGAAVALDGVWIDAVFDQGPQALPVGVFRRADGRRHDLGNSWNKGQTGSNEQCC